MKDIKIVYIDDSCDEGISYYMATQYVEYLKAMYPSLNIIYKEIAFCKDTGYEGLMKNSDVYNANVILIDSWLFEQNNAKTGKFTGEQFKIILRKLFPYIEVLVITQHDEVKEYGIIHKYRSTSDMTSSKYYDTYLKPKLDHQVQQALLFDKLAEELKDNEEIDKMLIEKIQMSLDGKGIYDELKKSDIDQLIANFIELKESYK